LRLKGLAKFETIPKMPRFTQFPAQATRGSSRLKVGRPATRFVGGQEMRAFMMGNRPNKPDWLVVAEFWDGATGRALAYGLRKFGEPLIEIDRDHYFLSGSSFLIRGASRLLRPFSAAAFNHNIVNSIEDAKAPYLLVVKGENISPETLDAAAARGAVSIIYYPDYHFGYPNFDESLLEMADIVCTTKRFQLPYLRRLRGSRPSMLVQHGYASMSHRPMYEKVEEDEFLYDIFYAGNPDRYKLDWLIELARRFPEKRIAVAGHRWKALAQGTPLAPFVLGRAVVSRRLARLHQLSRINIAIHGGADPVHGWQDEVSTRTFEIPACRGFMLHIDNAEVRGLYDVPSEIDTFSTPQEMCEKIDHYLARPRQRAEMIERAYRRAVPAYSYDSRAREIRDLALQLGATRQP
jgi:spore maturation protein CgeB